MDYLAALALQERLVESKRRESSGDILLFVEHPHVYTLGRGGKESNVLAPEEVPVIRTSRGGDVTYHGPGQLVVYPIIDLRSKLRKDVHRYVRNLELSAIRTLKDFGLAGTRRPPFTGIWIGDKKIAAIGVAVRRSITFHGLALNVNPDLKLFQAHHSLRPDLGRRDFDGEGARQRAESCREYENGFSTTLPKCSATHDIEKVEDWRIGRSRSRSSIDSNTRTF